MRTAASLRRAIVVTAVSFLAANAALVFPARAVWRAHDAAGHSATGGPGTHDRARAGRPAPGAHQRAACGRSVDPPAPDARLAAALTRVLRDHAGRVAVGVTDQATGVAAVYHGTESFKTASIVKADILAVLLLQLQQAGQSIGAADRQLAARMIKDSDNAAASALWGAPSGEGPGLEAGNAVLGLKQTVPGPGGYWGLTTTTGTDQDSACSRSLPLPALRCPPPHAATSLA